jgi:transcriptional regulator with PAS, ATPase and Fis domain
LQALSRVTAGRGDRTPLRTAFEEALRRALPVRTIHLRDASMRWLPAPDRQGVESVAFEVPGPSPRMRGVLEATFDPGASIGEWDCQLLATAAHLAALVLELERRRAQQMRLEGTPAPERKRDGAAPLIGSTAAMRALRSDIERVAATDFTVLLEGESGVGKELVARQIHELSGRKQGPFVAVNCAALVETLLEAELFGIEERTATGVRGRRGKFEHADGGTLFLDEVSDLSIAAQAKLLRAIQEMSVERVGGHVTQRVDIRIIAATNRGLSGMVSQGLFRPDLFYRLSGVDILVPALRNRRADIGELAAYFLERHRHTRRLQFSASALQALSDYSWPGNVRELERLVERAIALAAGDVIELDDLPASVRGDFVEVLLPSLQRQETLRVWACRYARLVTERSGGNKRRAARLLGISYHTLATYLKAGDPEHHVLYGDRVHDAPASEAKATAPLAGHLPEGDDDARSPNNAG